MKYIEIPYTPLSSGWFHRCRPFSPSPTHRMVRIDSCSPSELDETFRNAWAEVVGTFSDPESLKACVRRRERSSDPEV